MSQPPAHWIIVAFVQWGAALALLDTELNCLTFVQFAGSRENKNRVSEVNYFLARINLSRS